MIEFEKLVPRNGPIAPTPLIPEDGLCLSDRGIKRNSKLFVTPPPVARKFARCFQRAWRQIPNEDRKALIDFWRPKRHTEPKTIYAPTIAFDTVCISPFHRAECRGGHELLFHPLEIDIAKPNDIVHVIAHELGHAISYPHGWYKQHKCKADDGGECVACECRAYSYMDAWGFDPFHGVLPKRKRLVERFSGR